MSKESYARGFCKVAEAAGVDPVVLAKFAQQYKTDGYVPEMKKGTKGYLKFPEVRPMGISSRAKPTRFALELNATGVRTDDYGRMLAKLEPRFAAWSAAHTNAATKAVAPLRKAKHPFDKKIPKDLKKMIVKIYHDEMKRTTSAPPVSVTSPLSITR